jgi:arylsulfate sulfotransferase
MLVKNGQTSPVVLDTDGNMRWTGAVLGNSFSSMFGPDAFHVGSLNSPTLYRMDVGGAYSGVPLGPSAGGFTWTNFHHDLSPGKVGMLAELDAARNGVAILESVLAEIDTDGKVLREWDLGRIFRDHMRAKGDDPANFVRDGLDWFHMNSAIYNAADNSLLISSRESFVVKLDYDTGAIRWLFGDTSKHWYRNYPSLRALALRLVEGKAPIGQHSLSVAPNSELLLFNTGLGSLNHPPGTPGGATRTFSTPSRYAIDEKAGTAREVWTYEGERKLFSDVCSSVYEGSPGSYLVAYSTLNSRTQARLLGVDSHGKVAFDFAYPTTACNTVFIAQPLGWTDLKLR